MLTNNVNIFQMSTKDLNKLQKFAKAAPREFNRAGSSLLNTMAFKTRENDIRNITQIMTVRSLGFVKSSLKVDKSNPRTPLSKQFSSAYSIKRENFTGWTEQQYGGQTMKREASLASRKGNIKSKMQSKARFKSQNRFSHLKQYRKAYGGKQINMFGLMCRVLRASGGGRFFLSEDLTTGKGVFSKGLFEMDKSGKIKSLRPFKQPRIKRLPWRDKSINQLTAGQALMSKLWQDEINRVISQYK